MHTNTQAYHHNFHAKMKLWQNIPLMGKLWQNILLMGNLFTRILGSTFFYSVMADADEQDKELQPLHQQCRPQQLQYLP